jgi:hypothetical protein
MFIRMLRCEAASTVLWVMRWRIIRFHFTAGSKEQIAPELAEDLIDLVRAYLKRPAILIDTMVSCVLNGMAEESVRWL